MIREEPSSVSFGIEDFAGVVDLQSNDYAAAVEFERRCKNLWLDAW